MFLQVADPACVLYSVFTSDLHCDRESEYDISHKRQKVALYLVIQFNSNI